MTTTTEQGHKMMSDKADYVGWAIGIVGMVVIGGGCLYMVISTHYGF